MAEEQDTAAVVNSSQVDITTGTEKPEVIVRNMRIDDSDFVGKMVVEAFHDKMVHNVGKEGLPSMVRANQDYHRLLTDRYQRIFVAEMGGERTGVIEIKIKTDNFRKPDFNWPDYIGCFPSLRFLCLELFPKKPKLQQCYVEHIAVESKFRGCGIGKALLDRADAEARSLGCTTMFLHCTTTNRARNLYTRHGYEVVATEDGCCFTWCPFGVRYLYRMEKQL